VPFYTALKRFLAFLNGETEEPHEEEIVFANVNLSKVQKSKVKIEPKEEAKDDLDDFAPFSSTAMKPEPEC